jgi:hypothetical protein
MPGKQVASNIVAAVTSAGNTKSVYRQMSEWEDGKQRCWGTERMVGADVSRLFDHIRSALLHMLL